MNIDNPFVSVVMPVYNCKKDVKKAIESIQAQVLEEWELIIVDDCSTDGTVAEIEKYVKKDSRISLIVKEKNSGPGYSKNLGIKRAKGKYVTFLDGDDWISREAFFEISKNKTADEDVVIAGYYRDVYNEKMELETSSLVGMGSFISIEREEIIRKIPEIDKKRLFSFAWNKFYKREIIDKYEVIFSNKKFGEDFDFNMEFFAHVTSIRVLEEGFYHYIKKNVESLTERYVPDFFEINRERFQKMKKFMECNSCYCEEVRQAIMTAYIKHVLAAIARLYDERAKLSEKNRRQSVEKMLTDEMSKEAFKYARADGLNAKICNAVFKTNSITINLIFGRLLWFIQTKGKKIFERMK